MKVVFIDIGTKFFSLARNLCCKIFVQYAFKSATDYAKALVKNGPLSSGNVQSVFKTIMD